MKELVEVIAKALVDNPDEVSVMKRKKGVLPCLSFMSQKAIWAK